MFVRAGSDSEVSGIANFIEPASKTIIQACKIQFGTVELIALAVEPN